MFDLIPQESFFLLLVSLIVSAIGFYRLVLFVSVGYAFSIVGMVLTTFVLFRNSLDWLLALQCLLLGIYGLRLGFFVIRRERQHSYRRELAAINRDALDTGLMRKVLIWLAVSLLYILMFSPALLLATAARAADTLPRPWVQLVGIGVMLIGLVLEAVADRQKSRYKQQKPDRFCDVGLYRWVRCPNYLGEILFWTGNWFTGLLAYSHWLFWVATLAGLIGIIFVMINSTAMLERTQDKRYGTLTDYQDYVQRVPILFPFVPVFSLKSIPFTFR